MAVKSILGKIKSAGWDGTPDTGFVTDEENRPPRECHNCRFYQDDKQGDSCGQKNVMADKRAHAKAKKNGLKTREDGRVPVKDAWCCNYFKNKAKK